MAAGSKKQTRGQGAGRVTASYRLTHTTISALKALAEAENRTISNMVETLIMKGIKLREAEQAAGRRALIDLVEKEGDG